MYENIVGLHYNIFVYIVSNNRGFRFKFKTILYSRTTVKVNSMYIHI